MFYFKRKIGWDFYDLNKVNKKKKKFRWFVVGYVYGVCFLVLYNVISLRICNYWKVGYVKRDLKYLCFDLCILEVV